MRVTGLSIASTAGAIETYDQLGGSGKVSNKALAIPGHLNRQQEGPWASIEYVSVHPAKDGEASSVGLHTQPTDEMYYILSGHGLLTTNGVPAAVSAGWVALAPRGTTHTICNTSTTTSLSFLVIELYAPAGAILPPALINLAAQMQPNNSVAPVRLAGNTIRPRTARLDLQEHFGGYWSDLLVTELPPGARVEEYCEAETDQLWLLGDFASAFITKRLAAETGGASEVLQVDCEGEGYHCLVIPPGVPRRLENRASGPYPAFFLCVNVHPASEVEGMSIDE